MGCSDDWTKGLFIMLMLSVLTAPRPVDYLVETTDALDAAGAHLCDEKWIVTDGIAPGMFDNGDAAEFLRRGWDLHYNAQRTGNRLATWRVLQLAVERQADWLIFCEDDIAVAPHALRTIAEMAYANTSNSFADDFGRQLGFVTFYDPQAVREGAAPGIYTVPAAGSSFWGSLCLLI